MISKPDIELALSVCDEHTAEIAESLLVPTLLRNDSSPDWFAYAVREGLLERALISLEGEPIAVLWYQAHRGKLIVEMVQSVSRTRLNFTAFDSALQTLARANDCKVIEGRTRRKGMIKMLTPLGWEAESVNLVKKL